MVLIGCVFIVFCFFLFGLISMHYASRTFRDLAYLCPTSSLFDIRGRYNIFPGQPKPKSLRMRKDT